MNMLRVKRDKLLRGYVDARLSSTLNPTVDRVATGRLHEIHLETIGVQGKKRRPHRVVDPGAAAALDRRRDHSHLVTYVGCELLRRLHAIRSLSNLPDEVEVGVYPLDLPVEIADVVVLYDPGPYPGKVSIGLDAEADEDGMDHLKRPCEPVATHHAWLGIRRLADVPDDGERKSARTPGLRRYHYRPRPHRPEELPPDDRLPAGGARHIQILSPGRVEEVDVGERLPQFVADPFRLRNRRFPLRRLITERYEPHDLERYIRGYIRNPDGSGTGSSSEPRA